MIKEAKNVDFYTTGRQPSDQDFARISDWIRKDKEKKSRKKVGNKLKDKSKSPNIALAPVGQDVESMGGNSSLGSGRAGQ